MAKLQELDLSQNRITVLEECTADLAPLDKLRILNLNGNPIQTVLGDESLRLVIHRKIPQIETLDGQPLEVSQ